MIHIKTLFSQGASHFSRLFIVIVISSVLMFIDHHEKHLQGVRNTIGSLMTPVIYLADLPNEFFAWGGQSLVSRSQLRQENQRFKEEARVLKSQLQKYIALQAENSRLRNLLGTENQALEKRLLAEIIQIDDDPFRLDFVINKGTTSGVFEGQTVIDANGMVGQVETVFLLTSRVLMISDARHAIPVRVARNNVRSVLAGSGHINQLFLRNVTDTTDIKVGDVLISSGLGQKFPVGYPVATVTEVVHDPGKAYALIAAKPMAKLEQLSSVLLVWKDKVLIPRPDSTNAKSEATDG
ncbi:MAG: rod shape-determining protein MreC [Kangiellaceae bacterium]|nr:rod shape-determining protein MreC [Kangiellaceae bacterium]